MATTESLKFIKPTTEQCVELMEEFRSARAMLLRDAESFHEAARALERLGRIVRGRSGNGLKDYESSIAAFIKHTDEPEIELSIVLYEVVRLARNDAVHQGSFVRHLSEKLVKLLLICERAIMSQLTLVRHIMVPSPIQAMPWHTLGHVRTQILANAFSSLVYHNKSTQPAKIQLLTDAHVMKAIYVKQPGKKIAVASDMTVEKAIQEHILQAEDARPVRDCETLENCREMIKDQPVVVLNELEEVVGIVTPSDLL